MKPFTFLVIGVCLAIPGASQAGHDRLQEQEQCERLCLSCLEQGANEQSLCVEMSHFCCWRNGGKSYGTCGCRTEL
jgi:hypothetical protein